MKKQYTKKHMNETLGDSFIDDVNDMLYKGTKARFNALPIDYDRLPDYAQRICKMTGGFYEYDVVYDSIEDIKARYEKLRHSNIKVNGKNYPMNAIYSLDADVETCEGEIGQCIKYLRNDLEADFGYVGGLTLKFDKYDFSDEDFTKFCMWMNVWLRDWINGIKRNPKLRMRFDQNTYEKYAIEIDESKTK